MKIKEVIEKTGLTDRAIRLYIDEGLAAPNIEESYSGRKSIEFSPADVERLNNVALLRKAGFSIADIKRIVDDKETVKEVVEKFIEQTENNIKHESEIVEKLKSISFDEEVTIETICNSLSAAVGEKEVPKEDLKRPVWERITQKGFIVFAVVAMHLSMVALLFYFLLIKDMFVHLYFAEGALSPVLFSYGGWIPAIVLSVVLLAINVKRRKNKTKRICHMVTSFVIMLLIIFFCIFSSASSALGIIFVSPSVYSLTTNPKDYLVLDDYINEDFGDEIDMVFPDKIPESAVKLTERKFDNSGYPFTTQYFYRHTWVLDPDFDLIAEWKLPQDEYETAKNEITMDIKKIEQKGDWICLYYADTVEPYFWDSENYWFLIFAFNDKTQKVRYIASYAVDSYSDGPYYLSLDW